MDDEIFIGVYNDFGYEDYLSDLNDRHIADKRAEELQKMNFKKGKHTHAYREDLLNSEIVQMRQDSLTFEEIADRIGCSPNTVRNRLNKLKAMNLI